MVRANITQCCGGYNAAGQLEDQEELRARLAKQEELRRRATAALTKCTRQLEEAAAKLGQEQQAAHTLAIAWLATTEKALLASQQAKAKWMRVSREGPLLAVEYFVGATEELREANTKIEWRLELDVRAAKEGGLLGQGLRAMGLGLEPNPAGGGGSGGGGGKGTGKMQGPARLRRSAKRAAGRAAEAVKASSGLLSMCEISCIISEFCTAASLLNQALSHWGWVCAEGRGTSATALRAGSPGHCTLTRHAEIVCVPKGLHKSATVPVGTSRSRHAGRLSVTIQGNQWDKEEVTKLSPAGWPDCGAQTRRVRRAHAGG